MSSEIVPPIQEVCAIYSVLLNYKSLLKTLEDEVSKENDEYAAKAKG